MEISRNTPYTFRNGKIAANRIVVPPMASQTADTQGFVTELTVSHYERLAEAGAGLIFVEYTFVHPSGRSEENQLGASQEAMLPGLQRLAQTLKKAGALVGLQLVHSGGKSTRELTGGELQAPSSIPVPAKDWQPDPPTPMNEEEIQLWRESFTRAAERAQRAGFDIVELHAAHGYGLNQWLSPLTNQRSDQYGGAAGRSRLLLEIVDAIKSATPDLLLAVRLPAQDHLPGGLTVQEMREIVKLLEAHQVDLLDVSSGLGGWRRPQGREGEGYLVADASELKLATKLPVIGVGGLRTGPYIDSLLRQDRIDFAAVGRAILEDPRKWGQEVIASAY